MLELTWQLDPLDALARWPADRRVAMLHSGRHHLRWSRWCILAEPTGSYRFSSGSDNRSQWSGDTCPIQAFTHNPFDDLRACLKSDNAIWLGHLGYDIGRWIEVLPANATDDRDWPLIEFARCPGYLLFDLATKQWSARGTWADDGGYPDLPNLAPNDSGYSSGQPHSVFTRTEYERAVQRGIDYIADGDVFQVNIAQRFTSTFDGDYPRAQRQLFRNLASISPAWYGAYLELAREGDEPHRVIASTSPELFLEVDRNRNVTTRPIKGTRPADTNPNELRDSEKDTAELTMIVDLMRNDIGRVCDYGSVCVTDPRSIESHPTIHHGVATIEGLLHESKDVIDLLRATMPGGSITGAPKVRTMEIIDELEPVRRGPYCGAIGMLSRDHTCLNIAIRTMLIEQFVHTGRIDFSVGGGIVADSDPAMEFQETLDKAAAMIQACALRTHTLSVVRDRESFSTESRF